MSGTEGLPVLRSLPPIAVGTPDVESAQSYVWRLAEAHDVPWQTLHKFINGKGPAIYGNLRGQVPRLDAPTAQAAAYVRRVAELTGQPGVASLGLSWLAGRVRAQHVLRNHRMRCRACVAEMRSGDRPVYTPMTESLASVSHCARHGQRLQGGCSRCEVKDANRRVERCAGDCFCDYASTSAKKGEAVAESPTALEAAVLEQMGLLVSLSGTVGSRTIWVAFDEVVVALHRKGYQVSPGEMARRMGVSKGTISSLMHGRSAPGIDLLLRLSSAYRVRLPDLLLRREGDELWLQRATRHERVVWPGRAKPRIEWDSVQQALQLEMASEVNLPVAQVARRLQIDARHLAQRRMQWDGRPHPKTALKCHSGCVSKHSIGRSVHPIA